MKIFKILITLFIILIVLPITTILIIYGITLTKANPPYNNEV